MKSIEQMLEEGYTPAEIHKTVERLARARKEAEELAKKMTREKAELAAKQKREKVAAAEVILANSLANWFEALGVVNKEEIKALTAQMIKELKELGAIISTMGALTGVLADSE
jgi:enoyl-[acyl-carrier-protein] reductase (NADH)